MRISVENSNVFPELRKLLTDHGNEVLSHGLAPDPNFEAYAELMARDLYVMFTVRHEGELVGYAGFFVNQSLHVKTIIVASCDLIYMKPEHRGWGHNLIEFANYYLKASGVAIVYHTVTEKFDYSKTLTRQGFKQNERIFAKKLID
jgi:GNAT superfamily N-acetyltransferase